MKMKKNIKKYEKPVVIIKRFVVTDIISSSGLIGNIYIGEHEYRYWLIIYNEQFWTAE